MDITDALFDPIERKFEDLVLLHTTEILIALRRDSADSITIQTYTGRLFFSSAPGCDICNIVSVNGLNSSFMYDGIIDCRAEVSVLDNFLVMTRVRFTNPRLEVAEIIFEADYPVKLFEVVTC